jgi:hypothetical protein
MTCSEENDSIKSKISVGKPPNVDLCRLCLRAAIRAELGFDRVCMGARNGSNLRFRCVF